MKTFDKRVVDPVSPRQQRNWDWRAACNFVFGGAGGGLLALAAITPGAGTLVTRIAAVLGLALIGAGLTCVWFEIGRPWRALNVFRHARTSWMTREAFVAAAAFPLGALLVLMPSPLLAAVCGLIGLVFVYCQARILQANKGIPAWRHPRLVALVLCTGLAEGAGLLAGAIAITAGAAAREAAIVLLVLLALRLWLWHAYRAALGRDGAPTGCLQAFDAMAGRFVWVGHVAPALAIVAALAGLPGAPLWLAAGGLLALGGGWFFKATLVLRAAYTQGLAIKHLPSRGAGPSGTTVKPGW
jgi:phenylacetyl-CoA:acceptor oxidoreductase subunit 2